MHRLLFPATPRGGEKRKKKVTWGGYALSQEGGREKGYTRRGPSACAIFGLRGGKGGGGSAAFL